MAAMQPSWISDRIDLVHICMMISYFSSTPQCFLPSFKSFGHSFQEKLKIDFQDGGHAAILDFHSDRFGSYLYDD